IEEVFAALYSSSVLNSKSLFVTVIISVTLSKAVARRYVLRIRLSPSGNDINGFGLVSRDSGHKRLPTPPDIMTGIIFINKPFVFIFDPQARHAAAQGFFANSPCNRFSHT